MIRSSGTSIPGSTSVETSPAAQLALRTLQNLLDDGQSSDIGNRIELPPPSALSREDVLISILNSHPWSPDSSCAFNLVNKYGQNLAHLSAQIGYHRLLTSVIEWGVGIAVEDANGWTPLQFARFYGDSDAMDILEGGWENNVQVREQGASRLTQITPIGSPSPPSKPQRVEVHQSEKSRAKHEPANSKSLSTLTSALPQSPRSTKLGPDNSPTIDLKRGTVGPATSHNYGIMVRRGNWKARYVRSCDGSLNIHETRDEIPQIYNVSKNHQPTQDEGGFFRKYFSTLKDGPRVTQDCMKETGDLLEMAPIRFNTLALPAYERNYALSKEKKGLVEWLLVPRGAPSKILEEIFLCVIEGGEMERRKKSVEQGHHSNAKAWPAPFALAAVCGTWRELVRSRPRLWKYLVLDVRDKTKYYPTPSPMIHERIRQHLTYSHNLPLDVTIIAWGDDLRGSIVPMILPLLREGNAARRVDNGGKGFERLELVMGGRNDRVAKYNEVLEGLPPAQHLALVQVRPANTEIRVPSSFCDQLRRIEAYGAVFRLQGPCVSVTECALLKTDQVQIHTVLDQSPNLECLTVDGIAYAASDVYSTWLVDTMAKLHTLAFRLTDLKTYPFRLIFAITLPALRKIILINMPDTVLTNEWRDFIDTSARNVDEVEVRAIAAYASKLGKPLEYLAHLRNLPALTSLHLVGDCARHILGAMASRRQPPELRGVTHIHISDCTVSKHVLQMYGWSNLNPTAPLVWRRGNAKDVQVTLERVDLDSSVYSDGVHVCGRSSLHPSVSRVWRRGNAKDIQATLEKVPLDSSVYSDDARVYEQYITN
jgi:hypothetical protein